MMSQLETSTTTEHNNLGRLSERRPSGESTKSSTSESVPGDHSCDFEPALEFDDTELVHAVETGSPFQAAQRPTLGDLDLDNKHRINPDSDLLESPMSDSLMDENFEEVLGTDGFQGDIDGDADNDLEDDTEEDFADIEKYGIIEIAGDDSFGRKVIVISACKLPSNKSYNHGRLLRYLMQTLDQFVEADYTIVYFHYGLNSKNKLPLSWLWEAYKAFGRKYKKNLKALYLVHPTNFIRFIWRLFRPVISAKFGKKVMYVNYLHELKEHLHFEQVAIPKPVLDHDKKIVAVAQNGKTSVSSTFHTQMLRETQQFRVSLIYLKDHNNGDPIPRVMRECITYLDNDNALETEGIFRRSASTKTIQEVESMFDEGKNVHFEEYDDDIHVAAVMLKRFLREMEEPILTFDLYDDVMEFQELNAIEKLPVAKSLILDRLPDDNYEALSYLMDFLVKVVDRCDLNKMTSSNLAIVFGPNLLWAQNKQASLFSISRINHFTEFLLKNHDLIFTK